MATENLFLTCHFFSPMKLKFDIVRDIPQPNNCAKFHLILT